MLSESLCCVPDGQIFIHEENQLLEYQDVLKTLWGLRDEPGQPICRVDAGLVLFSLDFQYLCLYALIGIALSSSTVLEKIIIVIVLMHEPAMFTHRSCELPSLFSYS